MVQRASFQGILVIASELRVLALLLTLTCAAALQADAWAPDPTKRSGSGYQAIRQIPQKSAEYIVRLSTDAAGVDEFCEQRAAVGRPCRQKFKLVLLGCSVELTGEEVANLRVDRRVHSIDTNDGVRPYQSLPFLPPHQQPPPSLQQSPPTLPLPSIDGPNVEARAPWNLNRISHPSLPVTASYTWASDGSDVNVYVLDTGIRLDHEQFEYSDANKALGLTGSRAKAGFSSFGDNNSEDCFGHGTHVSGIIGGLTYGVAKNVTLHAVRCIDCNGDSAVDDIIAGLEWVAANFQFPAVASLSLGTSGINDALDAAVLSIIQLGITAVIAAGNFGSDACDLSPARLPQCIAVAATDVSDTRWTGSNYGSCVDLYAPGVAITSAMYTSPNATISATGTSMACPHVSGVAAQYLQLNPTALPAQVQAFIRGNGVSGKVNGALEVNGTPNLLLQEALHFTLVGAVSPATLGPVVSFENQLNIVQAQTIVLGNIGNISYSYQVASTDINLYWVAAFPAAGALRPNQTVNVSLEYDPTQVPGQGRYDTSVLVTMSEQPYAKAYAATLLLFCEELSTVRQSQLPHTYNASITRLQDGPSLPPGDPTAAPDWTIAAAAVCPTCAFAEAVIRFSHPVAVLPQAALSINDSSATILLVNSTGPRGALCSEFSVLAMVPISPWETLNTTVCLSIMGDAVADVDGNTFPNATVCRTLDHRPRGTIVSTLPTSSYSGAPVTGDDQPQLFMTFTEPVVGLRPASFNVTLDAGAAASAPAAVQTVQPAGGQPNSTAHMFYTLQLALPPAYIGIVNVTLQDPVLDSAQQANFPVVLQSFVKLAPQDFLFGTLPPVAFTGVS